MHKEAEGGVQEASEVLEKIVPELTCYCSYLRSFIFDFKRKNDTDEEEEAKEVAWFFVSKQLLDMTSAFDFADEMGRQSLARLCRDLLTSKKIPIGFTEPSVRVLGEVQQNPNSRIQEIAEIISELREEEDDDDNVRVINETLDTEGEEEEEECLTKGEKEKLEENQRKKQVEAAKLRVKLNILKNDLDNAISSQDFIKAQEIKIEMDGVEIELGKILEPVIPESVQISKKKKETVKEKEPEPPKERDENEEIFVTRKSLEMLGVLLESSDIKSLNGTLLSLLDELIIPAVQSVDFNTRKSAVKAMGQCCIRDLAAAKRQLLLIVQMIQLDTIEVRLTALQVVYDLLMWYGLTAFNENSRSSPAGPEEESNAKNDEELSSIESVLSGTSVFKRGQNLTQDEIDNHGGSGVVAVLSQLLDEPDIETRTLVIEGLCKLMMCGSIASPKLISRLLLVWYNPITEVNGKLRHVLGTFFPLYASFSRANQDVIEQSFAGTLNTLFEAPVSSPLSEVDIEDVGTFYIQLTRSDLLQNQSGEENHNCGLSAHDAMAYTLCNQILQCPDSFYVKVLIKLLTMLYITPNNFNTLKEIKTLNDRMIEEVKDKLCIKALEKFGSRLDEFIRLDPTDQEQKDKTLVDENVTRDVSATEESEINSMNITKMAVRKRALFNETNNTLLDLTSLPEKSESLTPVEENDGFKVPGPPKSSQTSPRGSSLASASPLSSDSSSAETEGPPSKVTRIEDSDESTDEEVIGKASAEKKRTRNISGGSESGSFKPPPPKRRSSRTSTSSVSSAEATKEVPERRGKRAKKASMAPTSKGMKIAVVKIRRIDESGESKDDIERVVSGNIVARRMRDGSFDPASGNNVLSSTKASAIVPSPGGSSRGKPGSPVRRSPRGRSAVKKDPISSAGDSKKRGTNNHQPDKVRKGRECERSEDSKSVSPSARRSKRTLTTLAEPTLIPSSATRSSARKTRNVQDLDSSSEFQTPTAAPAKPILKQSSATRSSARKTKNVRDLDSSSEFQTPNGAPAKLTPRQSSARKTRNVQYLDHSSEIQTPSARPKRTLATKKK